MNNDLYKIIRISYSLAVYIKSIFSNKITERKKFHFYPIVFEKIKNLFKEIDNCFNIENQNELSQTLVPLNINEPTSTANLNQQNLNEIVNCKKKFKTFVFFTFISKVTTYILIIITNLINFNDDYALNHREPAFNNQILYYLQFVRKDLIFYLFKILHTTIKWDSDETLKIVVNFINYSYCYKFETDSLKIYITHEG